MAIAWYEWQKFGTNGDTFITKVKGLYEWLEVGTNGDSFVRMGIAWYEWR